MPQYAQIAYRKNKFDSYKNIYIINVKKIKGFNPIDKDDFDKKNTYTVSMCSCKEYKNVKKCSKDVDYRCFITALGGKKTSVINL